METDSSKCVIVVDTGIPMRLKVNTAGLLGATLGRKVESIIGPDAIDGSGESHTGILNIPLPILATDAETIKGIREKALKLGGLLVVDFTETAQRELYYEDYTDKLASTPAGELKYLGIALHGSKKSVNRLVGNLPLLR